MAARKKKATPAPNAPVVSPVVTMAAFVERAAAVDTLRTDGAGRSSQRPGAEWAGAEYDDAVRMGRYGWPDGVTAVSEALSAVGGVDNVPSWEIDVAGAFCCAPAYMTGSPDCMFARTIEETERRRVALCFPLFAPWNIDACDRIAYAAALARVVAESVAGGVEIAVYGINAARDDAGVTYLTGFEARGFGDALDLDRLAFAFHPAMHRRLTFAYLETLPGFEPVASKCYGFRAALTVDACAAAGVTVERDALRIMPDIDSGVTVDEWVQRMRATMQAAQ